MTLRGYYRDHHRDIQFVPVYFSYERVLEISSYLDERKGLQKKTESLRDLFGVFRYLNSILARSRLISANPFLLSSFCLCEWTRTWK